MDRLKGKVSIVTGANSGIGKRTAEIFADEGSNLVLVARRLDKLKEVEAECAAKGVKVISVSADVSIYEDCQKVVKEAIDAFGKIDVLVNNAGIADKHRPITRIENDWWDHVIQVDQYSVYYMMKEVLPLHGKGPQRLHRQHLLHRRRGLQRRYLLLCREGCRHCHDEECGHSVRRHRHPLQLCGPGPTPHGAEHS